MSKQFLPDDYETPATQSNYMKFKQGENRFRILGEPIFGWIGWKTNGEERRPFRFHREEKPVTTDFDKQRVNFFWAIIVWNYNEEAIQILDITQFSIQKAIEALARNAKWGPPYDYDITVTRKGESLQTEYAVMPDPKTPVAKEIMEALIQKPINLNALYDGEDPFEVNENQVTEEDPFESPPLPTEVNIPD